MNKTLILGAYGFIGSYISLELEKTHDLIKVGRKKKSDYKDKNFVDFQELGKSLGEIGKNIDNIIIACQPNNISCKDEVQAQYEAEKLNSLVLKIWSQNKGINIINISTLQAFEINENGITNEMSSKGYNSVYAKTHNMSNKWLMDEIEDMSILYPSNVFGTPLNNNIDRKTLVPMCFLEEIFQKNSLTINSHGKQRRNFVSAKFIAERIATLISRKERVGESIICSELNLSIREIANITIDISQTVGFDNIAFNIQSDKSCDDYQNFCVESLDSENIQCHGDARDSLYASIKGYINYMHDRSK